MTAGVARDRRLPPWLAMGGAVTVGVLTTTQAQVNGSLAAALADAQMAALVSFGSGFLILLAIVPATSAGRAGLRELRAGIRAGRVPWWMLLGGCAGAFTVSVQGGTVATIGVAAFTVGVVAGQTTGGIVLDRVGYGPGGRVGVTIGRLSGAVFAVAAVVVALVGAGGSAAPPWMLVLPFLAGAGISYQQATNGRLRHAVGSPLTATLVNFAVGTAALAAAWAVHLLVAGPPHAWPAAPWMYAGGALGVVYIFLSAAIVRHTGVLRLGLGSVVGLLATSAVLDAAFPGRAAPPLPVAIAAVAVGLAGVIVGTLPGWRRR
ncbi:DMT family transporter [Microbacterium sp. SORGH_AS_0888]|uniref:DMT family transporter n=1 Tax=Microbacterium sp. SORGH_AS_0888 TaxID=3041791 RepID=UPI00277D9CA4|nr:DMT family transporter [Microbacterium sp. SORGH_AS_0888]MDQ1131087.1 transporter family-2 protein [Microbacterium sp. SORGH_AS_0888]